MSELLVNVIISNKDLKGNPLGPARVWLGNSNVPGLAMSRSIGDNIAATVGVSSIPGIYKFAIFVFTNPLNGYPNHMNSTVCSFHSHSLYLAISKINFFAEESTIQICLFKKFQIFSN
jgi:hypothetical protein